MQLAAQIEAQIEGGLFVPGDRIPSVRRLREQHGVSLSTVLEACRVLEGKGLVRARPKSGYFVQRTAAAREPDTPTSSSRPRRVDASLAVEINLGIGNP